MAVRLAGGLNHACAVTEAGGVKCWGNNDYGQLGDGTTIDRHRATKVVGLSSGVVSIAAGANHTCALTATGGVKCWGVNIHGRLGDGTWDDSLIPVDVVGLDSGVTSIAAAAYHTCAVTAVGGVRCWGSNLYGELGDGTLKLRNVPVQVAGLESGVQAVSAGIWHTCALATTGEVRCWGNNTEGQLGDGTTDDHYTPVSVQGLRSPVTGLSAGGWFTCVSAMAGGVSCWGENTVGQLGNSTTVESSSTPVDVVGLDPPVSMFASAGTGLHSCAISTAGSLKCWGLNNFGQLGTGDLLDRSAAVDVVGLTRDVVSVAPGAYFTCAIITDDAIKCWGRNYYGQLGNGTTRDSDVPVSVIGFA